MGVPLLALTVYYMILPLISFFAIRHLNLLDAPVNSPMKIAQKQGNTSLIELTHTNTRNLDIRQPYQEIMEQLTFDSGFINCAGLVIFIAVLAVFFYYVSLLMLGGISDLYKGLNEQQKFRTADLNPVNGSSIYQEQTFEIVDHDIEVDKDIVMEETTKTDKTDTSSARTTATETTPTPKSENGSLNTSTDSLEKVMQSINTLDDDNDYDDDEGYDTPSKGLKPEFWGRNSMLQRYAERNPYTPRQSLSPVRSVSPKKDKAESNEVSLKINQLANITRNSVCHSPGTSFASSVLSTTTAFPQTTVTHTNDDSASILEDIVLQQ
ncbi:BA75_02479T0 [Komagataella pastoris]|uniref:BA75_02479T0 n=1 Tax=Komagataella pastoris TaxID=4922 RepID=A0A1B2JBD4_PICPA|nr:BA75_02479T0 [Komagataella pastoris]